MRISTARADGGAPHVLLTHHRGAVCVRGVGVDSHLAQQRLRLDPRRDVRSAKIRAPRTPVDLLCHDGSGLRGLSSAHLAREERVELDGVLQLETLAGELGGDGRRAFLQGLEAHEACALAAAPATNQSARLGGLAGFESRVVLAETAEPPRRSSCLPRVLRGCSSANIAPVGDVSRPDVKLLVKGKHGLLPADRYVYICP